MPHTKCAKSVELCQYRILAEQHGIACLALLAAPPTTVGNRPPHHPTGDTAALMQVYGVTLWNLGRVDDAREVFRRGVSQAPTNPQLLLEWALMEQSQGNLEDALTIFEQGGALPESHAPLLAAWADLAERMLGEEAAAPIRGRLAALGKKGGRASTSALKRQKKKVVAKATPAGKAPKEAGAAAGARKQGAATV